ncbi:hypothetical protein [Amycolatopsis arida]|uniref:hypothetical protein n=1 Tax=Amycolatopsis arida TaxID=587909 RepID=UPI0010659858|nr:hypothetical protein [Amycolatopsis arida]TDX84946.1 hypothetical protein CLV69_11730 [Amycolatopsis arida]
MDPNTPALAEVSELRRQQNELEHRIKRLTPQAISEAFTAGLRAEQIAVELGLSVSRVYQIRRENRPTEGN